MPLSRTSERQCCCCPSGSPHRARLLARSWLTTVPSQSLFESPHAIVMSENQTVTYPKVVRHHLSWQLKSARGIRSRCPLPSSFPLPAHFQLECDSKSTCGKKAVLPWPQASRMPAGCESSLPAAVQWRLQFWLVTSCESGGLPVLARQTSDASRFFLPATASQAFQAGAPEPGYPGPQHHPQDAERVQSGNGRLGCNRGVIAAAVPRSESLCVSQGGPAANIRTESDTVVAASAADSAIERSLQTANGWCCRSWEVLLQP